MAGTHMRCPIYAKLLDGTSIEIVDSTGGITGAIQPTSFAADITWATDKKAIFRSAGIFIHSPSAGKLAITADVAGADDITLTGGTTITGTLAVSDAVALAAAVTLATDKKLLFRDTGLFIHSTEDGKLLISADGAGADDITLSGAITLDDNVTIPTNKKIIFRSTGIYINSGAAGKLSIVADGGGADDITLSGGVTITGSVAATGTHAQTGAITSTLGIREIPVARTATADGLTTGTVAASTGYVTVTSASADNIIVLPAPVVGHKITLFVGANGYELRTSTPASISINGGSGADAESAIPANTVVHMTCVSSTAWVGFQQTSDGTLTLVEVAA